VQETRREPRRPRDSYCTKDNRFDEIFPGITLKTF
jgi:hypothetical protein